MSMIAGFVNRAPKSIPPKFGKTENVKERTIIINVAIIVTAAWYVKSTIYLSIVLSLDVQGWI